MGVAIILEGILNKMRRWSGFVCFLVGAKFCGHSDEFSCSIKCREYPDQLRV
jgi:hypothetical protein